MAVSNKQGWWVAFLLFFGLAGLTFHPPRLFPEQIRASRRLLMLNPPFVVLECVGIVALGVMTNQSSHQFAIFFAGREMRHCQITTAQR